MWTAPRPKSVREPEEVRARRSRSAPRRRHAGRSCLPAWERRAAAAARPPSGCTPAAPASLGTLLASAGRRDPGGSPPGPRRSAATSRHRCPPPRPASTRSTPAQPLDVIDVVQQRGEPLFPVPSCCLSYPLERAGRTVPALSPGPLRSGEFPLASSLPSIASAAVPRLCSAASPVLRSCPTSRARSSSACVLRLPDAACGPRRRRRPRDLPVPVRGASVVHGVSDRAGSRRASRWRCTPMWPSAYLHGVGTPECALRAGMISRLNTRPARSPVNASPSSLRTPPHDSGPLWFARPSSFDSFIHYTLPVCRRTGAA